MVPELNRFVEYDLGKVQSSEPIHLKGKLRCLTPAFVPEHIQALEADNAGWLLSHHLYDDDKKRQLSAICFGSLFAFRESNKERMNAYVRFSSLMLLLDDVLDNYWATVKNIKVIEQSLQTFLDILRGQCEDVTLLPATGFPQYPYFCSAFFDVYRAIKKIKQSPHYFLTAMEDCFSALLQEFKSRKFSRALSLNEYLHIRAAGGALDATMEFAFLLKELHLSKALRKHTAFKHMKYDACIALILANDVLSFAKEANTDHPGDNYIYIKQRENKQSLQSAFDACNHHYNEKVMQLNAAKHALLNDPQWAMETDLPAALEMITQHVQAHLEWALTTKRYAFYPN